jgi:hypothetical protein
VRPGFEGYGAVAYFDEAAALLEIHWCAGDGGNGTAVRPGDAGWAHAKWAFKTTAFVAMTADDHLVKLHLISANYMTTAIRTELPASHALRRLLKVSATSPYCPS